MLKIENEFEKVFANEIGKYDDERYYILAILKYCLRKLYVTNERKDYNDVNNPLYFLFRKGDSYILLLTKIVLNIIVTQIIYPFFTLFIVKSKAMNLSELNIKDGDRLKFDIYAGSIANFIKNFRSFKNIVKYNDFKAGLRRMALPDARFIIEVNRRFGAKKYNLIHFVLLYIAYPIILYSLGAAEEMAKRYNTHRCYASVLPPQNIFSIAFLKYNKESVVKSHGNFHDPQVAFQLGTKFIALSDVFPQNQYMVSNWYGGTNLLKVPYSPLVGKHREDAFYTLKDLFKTRKDCLDFANILVFSSAFDPGIERDLPLGIFKLLKELRALGYISYKVKLHPSESRFWFKVMHFFKFGSIPLVVTSVEYQNYTLAVGFPSTLINDLQNEMITIVYSPYEYEGWDPQYNSNVIYISRL